MRNYTSGFLYVAGGILVGAITAYVAANNAGQEALAEGSPWKSRVAALDKAAGIYVQDYYLMAGRLPLAPGQFLEASAAEDSDGNTLSASCSYDVVSAEVFLNGGAWQQRQVDPLRARSRLSSTRTLPCVRPMGPSGLS